MHAWHLPNPHYMHYVDLRAQTTVLKKKNRKGPHAQGTDTVWGKREDTHAKHIVSHDDFPPGDKMTPVPGKDHTTPPPLDERDWPSITHLSGTPASRMTGHDIPTICPDTIMVTREGMV